MQTNAQQIDAEPGEAGDDVAHDSQIHDAAVADDSTPTRVENDCVPKNDEERAIFFRVPTPKAAPGLIGPDTAEDGASETEECCETDNAVNHLGEGLADFDLATTLHNLFFHHKGAFDSSSGEAERHGSSFAKFFAQ